MRGQQRLLQGVGRVLRGVADPCSGLPEMVVVPADQCGESVWGAVHMRPQQIYIGCRIQPGFPRSRRTGPGRPCTTPTFSSNDNSQPLGQRSRQQRRSAIRHRQPLRVGSVRNRTPDPAGLPAESADRDHIPANDSAATDSASARAQMWRPNRGIRVWLRTRVRRWSSGTARPNCPVR